MYFTGNIFKKTSVSFGDVTVAELADRFVAKIFVGGQEVVKFPIVKTADVNEIALRISNVANQTGFIDGETSVTLVPVP